MYAQTQFIPGAAERCNPIRVFPVLPDAGAVEAVNVHSSSMPRAQCPAVPQHIAHLPRSEEFLGKVSRGAIRRFL
jgi:hypothetical protein